MFNGELYNYRELHDRLVDSGHALHGYGDSELIPHLYEEWGVDFVSRLRGMFALAVFDVTRGELVLARDPFGIKPLYYLQPAARAQSAARAHRGGASFATGRPERGPAAGDGPAPDRGAVPAARATQRL